MKKSIKIIDHLFAHAKYSTDFQESKYIEWNRSELNSNDDIVFYTDYSLSNVVFDNSIKYGWLLESPSITESSYRWIEFNNNKFNMF